MSRGRLCEGGELSEGQVIWWGGVLSEVVLCMLWLLQAVMKAGGGRALFVAMAAVVQARQHLKAYCMMDVALVPQVGDDTHIHTHL